MIICSYRTPEHALACVPGPPVKEGRYFFFCWHSDYVVILGQYSPSLKGTLKYYMKSPRNCVGPVRPTITLSKNKNPLFVANNVCNTGGRRGSKGAERPFQINPNPRSACKKNADISVERPEISSTRTPLPGI